MSESIKSVVIIGAGNVAWHLAHNLIAKGFSVIKIISKSVKSSRELGDEMNIPAGTNLKGVPQNTDIIIISVPDNAITEVTGNLNLSEQLVVHTSGSTPITVFEGQYKNYGILYPFQTLTKGKTIDFSKVTLCIEANTPSNITRLLDFANHLSSRVLVTDSLTRANLHLAAVFACNFSNHMYALAENILGKYNIDFEILKPLILETASKIIGMSPVNAQTGPAQRNDINIIEKHLKMLDHEPNIQQIYKVLSDSIQRLKNKESYI